MKSVFAPVAAAVLLASNALAQLTINTPNQPVVCQPLLLTWSGGTPPYFLSILPGNQPSAAPLLDFGEQTGTQLTWLVNITAGTSLGLNLRDQTGALAQSAPFTIQSSPNTSCLNGGSSSTGSTTGTGTGTATGTGSTSTTPVSTSTPATSPTPTPTTPVGTTTSPATSKPATTSATTTAPATSSSAASSAAENVANAALAGAFGIGAALFALVA